MKALGEKEEEITYPPEARSFAGDSAYAFQKHMVDVLLQDTPAKTEANPYSENLWVQQAVYHSAHTNQQVEMGTL